MAESSLVTQVNDWLIDQALGQPDIVEMFTNLCLRLSAIGLPIGRAMLMWSTLHPLFRAETARWHRGKETELRQFIHQDTSSDIWLRSPMHFMLEANIHVLRRRLQGPGSMLDFDVLKDLVDEGYTDYLVVSTELFTRAIFRDDRRRGIFVTWAADQPGGFTDEDIAALQRIQRSLATACKTIIQTRIARGISAAYLGSQTGEKVFNGLIRLGDGEETRALVWFSDLRNSTHLAEMMPSAAFLELLNAYFECAARPVIAAGGEVLAFIGDAVLAIFPIEDDSQLPGLMSRVLAAVQESVALGEIANTERRLQGRQDFRYGIALNIGTLMYGNIGVPERLAFSAIGPTVIEVARIEKLTKTVGGSVLATRQVAELEPRFWRSVGNHRLEGTGQPQEIFAFQDRAAAEAA